MGKYYKQPAGKLLTGFCEKHNLHFMGPAVIMKEILL
jgi:hypothetical protein